MSSLKTRFRRRSPRRTPKRRLQLLCEGEVTEPSYSPFTPNAFRHALVEVHIAPVHGVPRTLVDEAVLRKKAATRKARKKADSFAGFDEVWCIFDADEHPKIPEARQKAAAHGIEIAFSNPCFELWALLHYIEHTAPIDRHSLRKKLKKYIPNYDKELTTEQMLARVYDAIRRASSLQHRQERNENANKNPYTTVHSLVERIIPPNQ